MSRRIFDVDIDIQSGTDISQFGTRAMIYNPETEKIQPHPVGVYLEPVPVDSLSGLCSFDYRYGNEHGFMKVDLITNSAYDRFRSKKDIIRCLHDPNWDDLLDDELLNKLPHIKNHADVVKLIRPQSIEELADVLALIRPAKRKFITRYRSDQKRVQRQLYLRPDDGIYFKKSHAISYALMIVAVINKIKNPLGLRL